MTARVQFRVEEDTLAYLQSRGVHPNELARGLFLDEVRRMQAEERHARLRSMSVPLPSDGEDMVREDRDGRERWRPIGL